MIKKWIITGDTHGNFDRLASLDVTEETAVIILGDAGFNFYLNKTDIKNKKNINNLGIKIYCVRGNHEERPQNIPTMERMFDEEIQGDIYYEPDFDNIRYFLDYSRYCINGYDCLVIGGAYSVDKWWRLGNLPEETDKWTGWFKAEQLTYAEMEDCYSLFSNETFDFVFTHTCPIAWEPTDLFLSMVDQISVDKNMEHFLQRIKENINFTVWCFGHYHADRIERPHVEQYFHDMEDMDTIMLRWNKYDSKKELDWWLTKSPNFYFD